jgi:hypothetical protein
MSSIKNKRQACGKQKRKKKETKSNMAKRFFLKSNVWPKKFKKNRQKPTSGQIIKKRQRPTCGQTIKKRQRPTCGQTIKKRQRPTCGQAMKKRQRPTCGQAMKKKDQHVAKQ